MVGVRDLESREEFEPTERRLGVRVLERGEDEAEEGVSDRGEPVFRFLIGTLSFVKRVKCPWPEFRSGESLSVRFEGGVDSLAVVPSCSCFTMSVGCEAGLFFFLVTGDSTLGVAFREDTVICCLAFGDLEATGEDDDLIFFSTGFGEWVTGNSVFPV